jgi:hypothetical protein
MERKRTAPDGFEKVRSVGLGLPGVEESTMFGKPALKIRGKMFACLASHRSAEPGSLVVRTGFEQRAELLAADPDIYYITEHYQGYPAVLVRLPRIQPEILRDLLGMAYRVVAGEAAGPAKNSPGEAQARPGKRHRPIARSRRRAE